MRKSIFACAMFIGVTGVAAAGELGIASYYQNPYYRRADCSPQDAPVRDAGSRCSTSTMASSAIVKIVDRGPFIRGRIIDVSPAAASVLGFRQAGLAHVRIERISSSPPDRNRLSLVSASGVRRRACGTRGSDVVKAARLRRDRISSADISPARRSAPACRRSSPAAMRRNSTGSRRISGPSCRAFGLGDAAATVEGARGRGGRSQLRRAIQAHGRTSGERLPAGGRSLSRHHRRNPGLRGASSQGRRGEGARRHAASRRRLRRCSDRLPGAASQAALAVGDPA